MIRKRILIDIEKFRKLRERRNVTINEIADRINAKRRTVYVWISEGWPDDKPSKFNSLAIILGTTRESLLRSIQKKMH